jgi:hypothetical protein
LPQSDAELLKYEDWIKQETLAIAIKAEGFELKVEKAT